MISIHETNNAEKFGDNQIRFVCVTFSFLRITVLPNYKKEVHKAKKQYYLKSRFMPNGIVMKNLRRPSFDNRLRISREMKAGLI